jgi:hypothetical protein
VSRTRLDLIPVALAARTVYERAYGTSPPDPHLPERLNGLAYLLASSGGLYAMDPHGASARLMSRAELAAGHFRNGATEFHFLDERAPILHLGVAADRLQEVVAALLRQRNPAGTSAAA